jgi:hypothetical protein
MRSVIAALVFTTLLATAVLLAGVLSSSDALARAGLVGLLLVPVLRNVAFVIVEKRAVPRALASAVGLSLVGLYVWFLLVARV